MPLQDEAENTGYFLQPIINVERAAELSDPRAIYVFFFSLRKQNEGQSVEMLYVSINI